MICTVIAMDPTNFYYRVCSACERTLADTNTHCNFCSFNAHNPGSFGSKRLYRILLSIADAEKVFVVICFDRVARVLFGCSADKFFDFAKLNPFAAENAGKVLEGEMFKVTLSKPKNGNAQHLRVVSIVPLRSEYQPVIASLRELYGATPCLFSLTS